MFKRCHRFPCLPNCGVIPNGFTLVEMVTVIAVIAIIGTMSTGFIRTSVLSYVNTEQNLDLAAQADFALRKISRDVRNALPNSVRVTSDGTNQFLEFVPIKGAGRYRAGVMSDGNGDFLNFQLADTSFDVLSPALNIAAGSQLVVYNLGVDKADVYYQPFADNNLASITSVGNNLQNIRFVSKQFPQPSPNNRFYVVQGASSFVCDLNNGELLLYSNYAILHTQPSSLATLDSLTTKQIVVSGVSACSIGYAPGVLQRSGVVTIALTLNNRNGVARLMHIVTVENSP